MIGAYVFYGMFFSGILTWVWYRLQRERFPSWGWLVSIPSLMLGMLTGFGLLVMLKHTNDDQLLWQQVTVGDVPSQVMFWIINVLYGSVMSYFVFKSKRWNSILDILDDPCIVLTAIFILIIICFTLAYAFSVTFFGTTLGSL